MLILGAHVGELTLLIGTIFPSMQPRPAKTCQDPPSRSSFRQCSQDLPISAKICQDPPIPLKFSLKLRCYESSLFSVEIREKWKKAVKRHQDGLKPGLIVVPPN